MASVPKSNLKRDAKHKRSTNVRKQPRAKTSSKTPRSERKQALVPHRTTTRVFRDARVIRAPTPKINSSHLLKQAMFPDVSEAPAAVSSSNTHRVFKVSGDYFKGVHVHTCTPLYELFDTITSVGATKSVACMSMLGYTAGTAPLATLNRIHTVTLGPMFNYAISNTTTTTNTKVQSMTFPMNVQTLNTAYCFSQYRRKRAILHYQPSTSSGSERGCVLAFTADPCNNIIGLNSHFVSHTVEDQILGPTPVAPPDNASCDTGSNVVAFGAWNAWSMELPGHTDKVYNITPLPVYTGLIYGAYNMADVRDTQWGAITCLLNAGTGTGARLGRLWLEVEYEFIDPSPSGGAVTQLVLNPSVTCRLNRFAPIERKEGKSENKPTELVPDTRNIGEPPSDLVSSEKKEKRAFVVRTNGSRSTVHVDSDDEDADVSTDDGPEVVSPPKYNAGSTGIPGSSDYAPSSTPSSQRTVRKTSSK